jgi:hypothetical protein
MSPLEGPSRCLRPSLVGAGGPSPIGERAGELDGNTIDVATSLAPHYVRDAAREESRSAWPWLASRAGGRRICAARTAATRSTAAGL